MSAEDFRLIVGKISPYTEMVCLHLMGEPLAHPQLSEIIETCAQARLPVFFVSNGVLLREDKVELLTNPIFKQISFSLHSFFDNFPDKKPTSYLQKIFNFSETVLGANPKLFINYRLWNLGQKTPAQNRNAEMLTLVEKHYHCRVPIPSSLEEGKSFRLARHTFLHFDSEFTWPALSHSIHFTEGTCHGLRSHIGILADGSVVPCCLDKEGVINLGNILKQDLSEILANPRAKAMAHGFRRGVLTEPLCQRCNYIERFARPANV